MTQPIGPVMLDLEGPQLTNADKRLLKDPAVGGVILFARNVEDAYQVRTLCDSIRRVRGDLLMGIDQEGGACPANQAGRYPATRYGASG